MLFCAKIIVYFDSLVIISTFVNKDFKKSFFIPYPIENQFGTSRRSCACDKVLIKSNLTINYITVTLRKA